MNKFGPRTYDQLLENLQQDPEGLKKLNPEQEKILVRLNYAYSNMMLHRSPDKVSKMIQKQFGGSLRGSYNDISYAFKLFGKGNIINETGEIVLYEMLQELFTEVKKKKDYSAAAKIGESLRKFMETRLSRQQDFDPKEFNVVVINITVNPADVGLDVYSDEDIEKLRRTVSTKKTIQLIEDGNGTYQKR